MKILDPTAPAPETGPTTRVLLPRRLRGLHGLTAAVLTNRWKSMDVIAHALAARLTAGYGAAEVLIEPVPLNGGAPPAVLERVAARAQLAVVGLAN